MHPLVPFCLLPLRLADIAEHPRPVALPRAAAAAPVTCVEPATLARGQDMSGRFEETRATEHFLLAWNADNTAVTPEQVDVYADALESSWEVQIDQMGWRPPDQTDACLITVLLADFDDSWGDTGGYTDVVESGGVPYIILNTDWLADGDDWTQTLVAHEFNHASQFGYDIFWEESDWWYWESTAEWIPDRVYDDANTYTWSLWAYLDTPWRALDSMSGTVQYGHFAFNEHLAAAGDDDVPRMVWESASATDGVPGSVEAATGEPFEEVVAAYTSRVAALDVEERDVWLEAIGYFEMDPWTEHVESYPAEGAIDGRATPQERGQNFLHFSGTPGADVNFTFAGDTSVNDIPTDWAVTLATVATGGGVTHSWVYADADGAAALTISGLGDGVTDAYVGVVPLGEIGEHGAAWSWTAKPARDGDSDDPGEDEDAKACGCSTSEPVGFGAGVLFALLGLARRRGVSTRR